MCYRTDGKLNVLLIVDVVLRPRLVVYLPSVVSRFVAVLRASFKSFTRPPLRSSHRKQRPTVVALLLDIILSRFIAAMTSVKPVMVIAGLTPVSKLFYDSTGHLTWYDGVVTASKGGKYTVTYDDGDVETLDTFEVSRAVILYRAQHSSQLIELAFEDLDVILESSEEMDSSTLEGLISRWAEDVKDAVLQP